MGRPTLKYSEVSPGTYIDGKDNVTLINGSLCQIPLTSEETFVMRYFEDYLPRSLSISLPPVHESEIHARNATLLLSGVFPLVSIGLLYLSTGFFDLIFSSSFLAKYFIPILYLVGASGIVVSFIIVFGVVADNFFRIKDSMRDSITLSFDKLRSDFRNDIDRTTKVIDNLSQAYVSELQYNGVNPSSLPRNGNPLTDLQRARQSFVGGEKDVLQMLYTTLQSSQTFSSDSVLLDQHLPSALVAYRRFMTSWTAKFIIMQVAFAALAWLFAPANLWTAIHLIAGAAASQFLVLAIIWTPSYQAVLVSHFISQIAQTCSAHLKTYSGEAHNAAFNLGVRKARETCELTIVRTMPTLRKDLGLPSPGSPNYRAPPSQPAPGVYMGMAAAHTYDPQTTYYNPPGSPAHARRMGGSAALEEGLMYQQQQHEQQAMYYIVPDMQQVGAYNPQGYAPLQQHAPVEYHYQQQAYDQTAAPAGTQYYYLAPEQHAPGIDSRNPVLTTTATIPVNNY